MRGYLDCLDRMVADPVDTVEAIYGHFGLRLTGTAADAIRSLATATRAGVLRSPVHA